MRKGQKMPIHLVENLRIKHTGMKKGGHPRTEFKKGMTPWNKGKKMSLETREKVRQANLGKKHSIETLKKMALSHSGERNHNWKGGIAKDRHNPNEPKYKEWRMKVFTRDNFRCKIFNIDCEGQIQAHHILKWSEYPELRYEVNNGITLCIAHHPRKHSEEKRLSPYFKKLISQSDL